MCSQHLPDHPVDTWFATTTVIKDSGGGHATGFFFEHEGDPFLITNRHVVDRNSINGEPLEQVRIFTRPRNDDSTIEWHDLSLVVDDEPTWLSHPDGPQIDVVAVPLKPPALELEVDTVPIRHLEEDKIDELNTGTFTLTKELFRPNVFIGAGEQVMVLGYPFRSEQPHWPIVRNGFVASPYGQSVQGNPYFFVEARMHSGTSGSPIFTLPDYGYVPLDDGEEIDRTPPYLLGIHSGNHHYEVTGRDSEGPLDLNACWYIELVEEILDAE